ncbi:glycosyltransferase family 4 protein [Curtobacterium sp. NPDC088465]|uniref:glycosyltransferase family 4 protein n=1 Tax=Curtobacterium sp. NPDC088465 TaxID=3363967 RepID=UPI00381D56DA
MSGDDSPVWSPLVGSAFAEACSYVSDEGALELARQSDLLIAVKPFPETLGRAARMQAVTSTPVLADVDDPDIEVRFPFHDPRKLVFRAVTRPRELITGFQMKRLVKKFPVTVSNPVLQRRFGGDIVGHVRTDTGPGATHTARGGKVVFVGTNRKHKGVDVLREAVARLASEGFTLTVTDDEPEDAKAWEQWTGRTTLEEGLRLVRTGDIVVVPSLRGHTTSGAQLPAKLMDAMIAGRAIVVSDFAPLRWAVGSGGLVVAPGSVEALASALRQCADPALRATLGAAARERGIDEFSVDAVADRFAAICRRAIAGAPVRSRDGQ